MIFSFVLHIYTKTDPCSAVSSVGEEISDFGFGFEIRIPRKDQSRSPIYTASIPTSPALKSS